MPRGYDKYTVITDTQFMASLRTRNDASRWGRENSEKGIVIISHGKLNPGDGEFENSDGRGVLFHANHTEAIQWWRESDSPLFVLPEHAKPDAAGSVAMLAV